MSFEHDDDRHWRPRCYHQGIKYTWPVHSKDNILTCKTVTILKIRTPEKFAVIILKFEQRGFTIKKCVQKM